jgi:hypothetical protein
MTLTRGFAGLLAGLALLTGCATIPAPETRNSVAFVAADDGTLAARHAPAVIPEYPATSWNRIGRPSAGRDARGRERIFVDPERPAIYFQQRSFETAARRYTNLIYRVHFERVPFSLVPFHLTAGRNSGLLFVVTLDDAERPLLLTTVHSCGCYLAFVPTSHLPREAWPPRRDGGEQRVFGIALPGLLDWPDTPDGDPRALIFTRHGTHRVHDLGVADRAALARGFELVETELLPIDALKALPLGDGGTTSFYHHRGFRRGYVKGATKPFELLFMSWWSLDLHVGVDKEYGDRDETGTVFYTSLKPWARGASDMWRFAEFLEYWGWRLP